MLFAAIKMLLNLKAPVPQRVAMPQDFASIRIFFIGLHFREVPHTIEEII